MSSSSSNQRLLTSADRMALHTIVRSRKQAARRVVRAAMLLNLDRGDLACDVAAAHYVDERTVRNLRKRYEAEGLAALDDRSTRPRRGKLSAEQEGELKDHFKAHPPASAKAACVHIKKTYDVAYSVSGARCLLLRLKLRWRKPKPVPRMADLDAQREHIGWHDEVTRKNSTREAIFFLDAAHPEHQVRASYGWFDVDSCPAVKSATGRKRVNVLGALNVATGEFVGMLAERVNSATVAQLLTRLRERFGDRYDRVHVVLDNARYNYADPVKDVAAASNGWLELRYLPAYAPHLNPIERLWGEMHRRVTHNRWYETFQAFRDRIKLFLFEEVPNQWESMKSRVSDNFREITHEGCAFYNSA